MGGAPGYIGQHFAIGFQIFLLQRWRRFSSLDFETERLRLLSPAWNNFLLLKRQRSGPAETHRPPAASAPSQTARPRATRFAASGLLSASPAAIRRAIKELFPAVFTTLKRAFFTAVLTATAAFPGPRALPFSSSQAGVKGVQRSETSELTLAQPPRASLSPPRKPSPVLFSHPDLRPSAEASDLVSFGGSKDEPLNDSMSLVASKTKEGPSEDPAPLPSLEPIDARAGIDAELFCVLSKAVGKLDLEWVPYEEPTRSRLDEWFLP
ncbi:hypothetical protein DPX16_20196 [Anabarilius grahami]|uniref:Uncharacterized protein n=1 Tax=Anabarilius grahami TaxID=495550 RepID=A0A3N0XEB8_ANAGA|nr:hypothetical protein DPX16_20196 [Anabarilius grahami]